MRKCCLFLIVTFLIASLSACDKDEISSSKNSITAPTDMTPTGEFVSINPVKDPDSYAWKHREFLKLTGIQLYITDIHKILEIERKLGRALTLEEAIAEYKKLNNIE